MKKIIILTIVIFALGFLVSIGIINSNKKVAQNDLFMAQAGNEVPKELKYNLKAETDHIPLKGKKYQFIKPSINDNQTKSLAAKFGLDGTIKTHGNRIIIKDKNNNKKRFEINKKTGYYSYMNFDKLGNLSIKKNIPKDDVVVAKAKEYLNERRLLPERFNIVKVVNRTTGTKLKGTRRIVSKEVWFYPTVDGEPVYGISRIIVSVGHEGEIEAVRKYHREIEASSEVILKPFDQALDELKQGKASIRISEKAKEADIKKVGIGYWEDPNEEKLHPVYVFKGEVAVDGKIESFDAFLPAAKGVEIKTHPNEIVEEIPDTEKPIQ